MKSWLKLGLVIVIFACISILAFFILKVFGLTNVNTLREIITKSKNWAMPVFVLLETALLVCFCFVPVIETALVSLGIVLFGAWTSFCLSSIACIAASCLLFVIGDKFGERLAKKLIGEKELERAQDLVTTKSRFMLPIFFFIPGFPDDAICLVAGMTKMKFSHFFLISSICYILDVAIICFLGDFINWSTLTPIDWVLLVNILLIDLFLFYKLQNYLEQKNKNKK